MLFVFNVLVRLVATCANLGRLSMGTMLVSTSAYARPPVQTVRVGVGRKEALRGRKDYPSFDQRLRLTSFVRKPFVSCLSVYCQ